jgi:hypothetical protein
MSDGLRQSQQLLDAFSVFHLLRLQVVIFRLQLEHLLPLVVQEHLAIPHRSLEFANLQQV